MANRGGKGSIPTSTSSNRNTSTSTTNRGGGGSIKPPAGASGSTTRTTGGKDGASGSNTTAKLVSTSSGSNSGVKQAGPSSSNIATKFPLPVGTNLGPSTSSVVGGGGTVLNDKNGKSDSVMQDEVMRRRLLIDGDGTGDDRRILGLTKAFIRFGNAKESSDDVKISYRRVQTQLNQVDYSLRRSAQCVRTSMDTRKCYQNLGSRIGSEIGKTKQQIADSKVELDRATLLRRCSMEYDALGKLIETQPDRKKTLFKVETLTKEQEKLQDRRERLKKKLDQRKKTLSCMSAEVEKLREMTQEDDEHDRVSQKENEESSKLAMNGTKGTKGKRTVKNNFGTKFSENAMDTSVGEQIPMESNSDGNGILNHSAHTIDNICGTITSAPLSPVKPGSSENYEDLSEEDNELPTD